MVDKKLQTKTDYEITFGTAEGKRVLDDILKNTHVLEPTFSADPYITAFNEGARNEALRILTILQYKPQDFVQIVAQEEQDG
jgi:hypothetical protein